MGKLKLSARLDPHYPQVTCMGEEQNCFYFLSIFNSFAKKGRLLLWNLTVLHLYSFTTLVFCLVVSFVPTLVNKQFSLFKFFVANFCTICGFQSLGWEQLTGWFIRSIFLPQHYFEGYFLYPFNISWLLFRNARVPYWHCQL